MDCGRDAASVEEQDRPAAGLHEATQRAEERGRERVAGLAAQVDELHGRERGADPRRERRATQAQPALGPRRRRAVDGDGALERRSLRRDGARVVPGIRLLLVGGVVLLVDDDQADAAHGREDRRAGSDDDACLAARDPIALVAPLRVPQRGMDDRHEVAEPLPEAPDGLRRERDLRDEHDRPEAAVEGRGARLEVDLGLAAAGRALEEHVLADSHVERGHDPLDGVALVGRERLRLRLAGERLAHGRRRPLAAWRTADRRDELQRSRRGRAVVVGDPECEVDERAGDLVEHLAGGDRVDSGGQRDADVGDDSPCRATAEADREHASLADALGHLVGERPGERPGRDERVDGGERHESERSPAPGGPRVLREPYHGGTVSLT